MEIWKSNPPREKCKSKWSNRFNIIITKPFSLLYVRFGENAINIRSHDIKMLKMSKDSLTDKKKKIIIKFKKKRKRKNAKKIKKDMAKG